MGVGMLGQSSRAMDTKNEKRAQAGWSGWRQVSELTRDSNSERAGGGSGGDGDDTAETLLRRGSSLEMKRERPGGDGLDICSGEIKDVGDE